MFCYIHARTSWFRCIIIPSIGKCSCHDHVHWCFEKMRSVEIVDSSERESLMFTIYLSSPCSFCSTELDYVPENAPSRPLEGMLPLTASVTHSVTDCDDQVNSHFEKSMTHLDHVEEKIIDIIHLYICKLYKGFN